MQKERYRNCTAYINRSGYGVLNIRFDLAQRGPIILLWEKDGIEWKTCVVLPVPALAAEMVPS